MVVAMVGAGVAAALPAAGAPSDAPEGAAQSVDGAHNREVGDSASRRGSTGSGRRQGRHPTHNHAERQEHGHAEGPDDAPPAGSRLTVARRARQSPPPRDCLVRRVTPPTSQAGMSRACAASTAPAA